MSITKQPAAQTGKFLRVDSSFRHIISEENELYPPQLGRYHLYICNACPWANRCNAVRVLKGLEEVITLSVVHPVFQATRPNDPEDELRLTQSITSGWASSAGGQGHLGWVFVDNEEGSVVPPSGFGCVSNAGTTPDTVNGFKTVREIYEASGHTCGGFTVPILWDKQTSTIVNNESSEIVRMLNGPFARLVGTDQTTPELYPNSLVPEIDAVNEWVYSSINNGVYKCGFAKSQEAYEVAVDELTEGLDRVEEILGRQRYIASTEQMTEADLRLFMTLIRYDEVYIVYFKTNTRMIAQYPNMQNYLRELYQMPFLQKTTVMDHIKAHYFSSHPVLNCYSVVPRGPGVIQQLLEPHDRDNKFSKA